MKVVFRSLGVPSNILYCCYSLLCGLLVAVALECFLVQQPHMSVHLLRLAKYPRCCPRRPDRAVSVLRHRILSRSRFVL